MEHLTSGLEGAAHPALDAVISRVPEHPQSCFELLQYSLQILCRLLVLRVQVPPYSTSPLIRMKHEKDGMHWRR